MSWIMANWAFIATVLLGISEALALIPGLQANSVLEAIINFFKGLGVKDPQAK
jgi:hypothetical protein